jgi:hypothetical protein
MTELDPTERFPAKGDGGRSGYKSLWVDGLWHHAITRVFTNICTAEGRPVW